MVQPHAANAAKHLAARHALLQQKLIPSKSYPKRWKAANKDQLAKTGPNRHGSFWASVGYVASFPSLLHWSAAP